MSAAVVICAYTEERWEELVAAVASVRAQTLAASELVVVIDNNPALLERAKSELEGATVVPNSQAPGNSGARNTGIEVTSAPILAFIDDDAVADAGWLEALMPCYEDPSTLGAGGPVVPLWRTPRPRWFTDEFNWVIGCTWTGMAAPDGAIRNPIGTNFSVRRDVIAEVGGFEGRLGRLVRDGKVVAGTADETEVCIRAGQIHPDGVFRLAPGARVHHQVPASRATWRYYRERCRLEGSSKAVLTKLVGTGSGLASERRYVRSVLPRGIWRELRHGGRTGPLRAGAIVAGLAYTGGAYLRAELSLRRSGAGDLSDRPAG